MYFGVSLKGPVYTVNAELRDDRAECSYGIPVLVLRGQVLGIVDIPMGSIIEVSWRKARVGPVWEFIQKAIKAGYPIVIDPVGF